jgi:hypothetical protein
MKELRDKSYPTIEHFKNALYRFVIREVLTDSTDSEETLKDHIYQSYLWDENYFGDFSEVSQDFHEALEIKLKHLYFILQKFPYELEWLEAEEEFVGKSKPKRNANRLI